MRKVLTITVLLVMAGIAYAFFTATPSTESMPAFASPMPPSPTSVPTKSLTVGANTSFILMDKNTTPSDHSDDHLIWVDINSDASMIMYRSDYPSSWFENQIVGNHASISWYTEKSQFQISAKPINGQIELSYPSTLCVTEMIAANGTLPCYDSIPTPQN